MLKTVKVDILRFFLGVVFLGLVCLVQMNLKIQHPSLSKPSLRPTQFQKYFSLSHRELFGDLYFIRSIQDMDFCETSPNMNGCKDKGWLFQVLDLASDLNPQFTSIFRVGALSLNIVTSDIVGATALLDKGRKIHPSDLRLLQISVYHELYEANNPGKAAEIALQAAKNGAPGWYYSLAGSLYQKAGKTEMQMKLVQDMEASGVPEGFINRLKEKMQKN